MRQLLESIQYTYIGRDGTTEERSEEILAEHSVDFIFNDVSIGKVTCIPEHLEYLALGRLLSEGLIESRKDITRLSVSASRSHVRAFFAESQEKRTFCVEPIFWKPEWIFDLADFFAAGSPLHEKTWATHSCILARDGEILFSCEDISRHNALDKVIGFAMWRGIPLNQCTVYSSGRIPADMAAKAIRAGIPILVSKASPTAAAVELARSSGLTLICAARRDRMKLFSGTLPE